MFPEKLKEVFDKAVKDSIEQIPATSLAFKEGELDVKVYVDNEVDFYLGVVMATILKNTGFMQLWVGLKTTTILFHLFQIY